MRTNNLLIGLGVLATIGLLPIIAVIDTRAKLERMMKEKALKKGVYLSNTDSINKMIEVTEYYNEIWNYEWED